MPPLSPLRYPGGKNCLSDFIRDVLYQNDLQGGTYIEPFAGGAAVALKMLFSEHVENIIINDADYCIFAIWESILKRPNQFIDLVLNTPITLEEWHLQRKIYMSPKKYSRIKVGFAAFYLNRCNRSGIIMKSGPIGGYDQKGKWKIDARFNREKLAERILKISEKRDRIKALNLDALDLLGSLKSYVNAERYLIYLDPPYYVQGAGLYLNAYKHEDHAKLADLVKNNFDSPWVMTYDNVEQIKDLYSDMNIQPFSLRYSAYESRKGKEVLITPLEISIPEDWSGIISKVAS